MNKLTVDSRKQFEKWFKSKHDNQLITKGDGYCDPVNQVMWQAWQASRQALEVERQGDWIEWSGGECPVPPGKRVDLKLRGGSITTDYPAGSAQWGHRSEDDDTDIIETDIMAYRVSAGGDE